MVIVAKKNGDLGTLTLILTLTLTLTLPPTRVFRIRVRVRFRVIPTSYRINVGLVTLLAPIDAWLRVRV